VTGTGPDRAHSPHATHDADARRLVTGRGRFVENLLAHDALHAVFVRSPVAHGRLRVVSAGEARARPGVVHVMTAAECALGSIAPEPAALDQAMLRPMLAVDTVRFVGEPVAVVVAETRAAAIDAAESVVVDIERLSAITDVAEASHDVTLVHEAAGTNTVFVLPSISGSADPDACAVVYRARLVNQRVVASPLEPRSVLAVPPGVAGPSGVVDDLRLTVWISAQGPHPVRDRIAAALHLPPESVRVICPDVGGAFGAKAFPHPEEFLVCLLALELGRPVTWTETRTEATVSLGHGRGQVHEIALGGRRDGTIDAYRLDLVQDSGAYPRIASFIPFMVRHMQPGCYRIPLVEYSGRSVATNTAPTVAYRGAGRPEATAAIERAVDGFAALLGRDPVDIRLQNFIGPDDMPATTLTGAVYDSGDYPEMLRRVVAAAGYDALRADQARRRIDPACSHRLLGIGVASYVEVTSFSNTPERATVDLHADGTVTVSTGTSPHGQGHAAMYARLVGERLGVAPHDVVVLGGDSDHTPSGTVTAGSRSAQTGGVAVAAAVDRVLDVARRAASARLEAAPADVVYDTRRRVFHVTGTPAIAIDLLDAVGEDGAVSASGGICETVVFDPTQAAYTAGAHLAVVEVDAETGAVQLIRFIACDDAGTVIDHDGFEGQVHGGVVQGIGQALMEQMVYDPDGNPLSATFADYLLPSAADVPSIETLPFSTTTAANPLGVKGIGESGAVGATPAVHNAVIDALMHLGVAHIDLPLTPQAVWTAIQEASS
jgi:aerobic carbon-monoxide dehydrogenase large subunit